MIRSTALSGKVFFARSIARRRTLLASPTGKSLVIQLDHRSPKHGGQEANDGTEKSRSTPEPFDLRRHLRIVIGSEIACNDIGHAAMNPASNGRARDVQIRE